MIRNRLFLRFHLPRVLIATAGVAMDGRSVAPEVYYKNQGGERMRTMTLGLLSIIRAVAVTLALTACVTAQEPFQDVDAAEAAVLLKDHAVFLLDVRTPGENTAARLAGDTLVPLQVLEQQLDALPKDKKRPVLVYCRSGNRSVTAARILAKHGHEMIYNLKSGIIGWQRAGLPVETGPRPEKN